MSKKDQQARERDARAAARNALRDHETANASFFELHDTDEDGDINMENAGNAENAGDAKDVKDGKDAKGITFRFLKFVIGGEPSQTRLSSDDFERMCKRIKLIFDHATTIPNHKIRQAGALVWEVAQDIFFTKDQAEILLPLAVECSEKFRWQNQLVAMCDKPWDVDVKLGGCGVCYFGNLGDKPANLMERIKMLVSNRRALNDKHMRTSAFAI